MSGVSGNNRISIHPMIFISMAYYWLPRSVRWSRPLRISYPFGLVREDSGRFFSVRTLRLDQEANRGHSRGDHIRVNATPHLVIPKMASNMHAGGQRFRRPSRALSAKGGTSRTVLLLGAHNGERFNPWRLVGSRPPTFYGYRLIICPNRWPGAPSIRAGLEPNIYKSLIYSPHRIAYCQRPRSLSSEPSPSSLLNRTSVRK